MSRPAVDMVVPFAGSDEALAALIERCSAIHLRDGDTLTIVDNRADARDQPPYVIAAPAQASSYYARNRGAARGHAPWLVFFDADVDPQPDILDRYFEPEPGDGVGLLAGGVQDAPLGAEPTWAERYALDTAHMSQSITLSRGRWAYAQTANVAVRRRAFAQVGGFTEGIRSGGDADFCFRLRVAGWELDARDAARVIHHNRTAASVLLRQKARHGAGAAWLNKRYPGSFPPRNRLALGKRLLREIVWSMPMVVRGRADAAAALLFPTITVWAFELGRWLPNRVKPR